MVGLALRWEVARACGTWRNCPASNTMIRSYEEQLPDRRRRRLRALFSSPFSGWLRAFLISSRLPAWKYYLIVGGALCFVVKGPFRASKRRHDDEDGSDDDGWR